MYCMPLSKWNKLCKRFQLNPTISSQEKTEKITQVFGDIDGPDGEI